jgi:HPt (histidine-containing phosphotransfer) domain-containing protein
MPEEKERKDFTTQAHALKSALLSIGAAAPAAIAARMEEAGRAGDMSAIRDGLDAFHAALKALLERVEAALARLRAEGDGRQPGRERELWARLKDALAKEDLDAIDRAMEGLKALPLAPDTRDALSGIAERILAADFKKAGDAIDV